jgi:hypothetical protein
MDEYREHRHVTPGGLSGPSVKTDNGHIHVTGCGPSGGQQGDFGTHTHVTGWGPTGQPIFDEQKNNSKQEIPND